MQPIRLTRPGYVRNPGGVDSSLSLARVRLIHSFLLFEISLWFESKPDLILGLSTAHENTHSIMKSTYGIGALVEY